MIEIDLNDIGTREKKSVKFYECDCYNRLKISEMLKISAELAGYDYTRRGLTYDYLMERDMVFLVAKVSLKIIEYPRGYMNLNLETWEQGTKGASFLRGLNITDESGKKLVEGGSGWVLVNPKNRKIIKPAAFPYVMPKTPDRKGTESPIGKIFCKNPEFLGEITVGQTSLDCNKHVYNANYADMAADFLPPELFAKNIKNFRINFNHEANYRDIIKFYGDFTQNPAVIIGKVEQNICFECEFEFFE